MKLECQLYEQTDAFVTSSVASIKSLKYCNRIISMRKTPSFITALITNFRFNHQLLTAVTQVQTHVSTCGKSGIVTGVL
jgi:hypothetical protein